MFLLLLLNSINQHLHCQIFGLLQNNPPKYYTGLLRYPVDGNYRILNAKWDNINGLNIDYQILVYSGNFSLIDSVNLPHSCFFNNHGPIKHNNSLIWAGANYVTRTTLNWQTLNKSYVFEFDSLYHLTNQFLMSSDTNSINQSIERYAGGYIWFHQIYNSISGTFYSKIFKLNNTFQKRDSVIIPGLFNQLTVFNNKIEIIGNGLPTPCASFSPTDAAQRMLELDTNLNIINCLKFLNYDSQKIPGSTLNSTRIYADINPPASILTLSNTKYFLLGTMEPFYSPSRLSAQFLLNSIFSNTAHIKTMVISDTLLDVCNYNEANEIDFDGKNIISIGCKGYSIKIWSPVMTNIKTKITVHKMDTLGNTIWLKEYGGEMQYAPKSIIFTKDGGCLIAGLRYDSAASVNIGMTNIGQSFLLKLDANGNYNALGLTENGKKLNNTIKCFPNPAQQTLFFDVPFEENIEVEIFDLLGRRVLRKENYKNYTAINIEGLAQGAYLYQIKTKTNFYSGKFLKCEE